MNNTLFILTLTKGDAEVLHVESFGRANRGEFMTTTTDKRKAYKFLKWHEAHTVKRMYADKVIASEGMNYVVLVCEYVPPIN